MKCPHCQTEVPADAIFCDYCGEKLSHSKNETIRPHRHIETVERKIQDSFNQVRTWIVDLHNSGAVILGVSALVVLAVVAVTVIYADLRARADQQAERQQIVALTATAEIRATQAAQAQATAIAATATAVHRPTATAEALAAAYERGVAAANIGDWWTAYESFQAVFDVDPTYRDVQERLRAAALALTPTATPTGTPTPVLTETPTPVPPTATPTATSTPTATATPSVTPTATSTPTVTRTPTATWTPTVIATPSATPTVAPVPGEKIEIYATGVGFPADWAKSAVQREQSALLAAELDAKAKLVEWTNGADIQAVTVVNQGKVEINLIRQVVEGHIQGAVVVDQSYDDDARIAHVTVMIAVDPSELP